MRPTRRLRRQVAASDNQSLDEVTVTGSRIRRTPTSTPPIRRPSSTRPSQEPRHRQRGRRGGADAREPVRATRRPRPATRTSFRGSTIANLRGLNPFFGSRTLNLVNSRRFVPTNQGDGVDLNFIPSILIDRVDMVTGGASAAYGSGAISGRQQHLPRSQARRAARPTSTSRRPTRSDGDERHSGLAYGASLSEGRGHVMVGYEYEKTDPIGCFNVRDWCREGAGFFQNITGHATGADSRQRHPLESDEPDWRFLSQQHAGRGFPRRHDDDQANAAGTGVIPFNLGRQPFAGASATAWCRAAMASPIYQYTNLRAPVKRNIATGTSRSR